MPVPSVDRILSDLVVLPSVNPGAAEGIDATAGEARVADYLCDLWASAGLDCERIPSAPGRDNVVARLDAPGRPTLLLESHMDTVSPNPAMADPFTPRVEGGRMYGLGACDDKASLAAMAHALLRAAEDGKPARSVLLAATVDEEFTFLGAADLLRAGVTADEAVVGEPTSLQVVVAHKGAARWRVATSGRSAHSSAPHLGVNAVYRMARLVTALEEYAAILADLPPHPLLGPRAFNVGAIHGGAMANIVPDACEILTDRRVLPGEDFEADVVGHLRDFVRERLGEDFAYGFEVILHDPPLDAVANRDLAARVCRLAAPVMGERSPVAVQFGTNASKYAAAGIPSVVFGPGHIAQAHTAEEWVDLDDVERAAELYLRLITEA
jgi:succinyl-diaminopimelate desuccinylase